MIADDAWAGALLIVVATASLRRLLVTSVMFPRLVGSVVVELSKCEEILSLKASLDVDRVGRGILEVLL